MIWKRIIASALAMCLTFGAVPLTNNVMSDMSIVFAADEQSGTCGDNLTWHYDGNGTLTISGTGDMFNYSALSHDMPWYKFDELTDVIIEEGVTSIGVNAFYNISSITTVTIPDSVTEIQDCAFQYCHSLRSIVIPEGVTVINFQTFLGCSALTSVSIPDTVTKIDRLAFDGCESLRSVSLPKVLTSIGERAFESCKALDSITIPDSVESIGEGAFSSCELTSIVVSSNNKYYTSSDGTLFNKSMTQLIAYPQGAKRTEYTIPDTVTYIRYYAFNGSMYLKSVKIPDSVTSIGQYAFKNCIALESIALSDNLTSIARATFAGCSSLKSVEIPEGVKTIELESFNACNSLTAIQFPDTLTSIENTAFSGCSNLDSIIIPESVTWIGQSAFNKCTGMVSIIIKNPDCTIYDWKYTIDESAIIYGYANSTAQAYAEQYNRRFIALDENGSMPEFSPLINEYTGPTLEDIKAIQAFLLNADYVGNGKVIDVNQDGVVDVFDLGIAKQKLLDSGSPSLVDFSADVYDIYLNTAENVTFTVDVTAIKPLSDHAIAIYDENNHFISYMNDDGVNGDQIADDGIYSAQTVLSSDEIKVVGYYAATEQVRTESYEISYYRDLTEDEFIEFSELQATINCFGFTEACEFVKNSDEIISYTIDEERHIIYYRSIYYLYGFWDEPGSSEFFGTGRLALTDSQIGDLTAFNPEFSQLDINNTYNAMTNIVSKSKIVPRFGQSLTGAPANQKKNVIVLRPFRNSGEDSQVSYDTTNKIGKIVADAMDGNLTVVNDHDVTISQLKKLGSYGVVWFETHGNLINDTPYIWTGEVIDTSKYLQVLKYSADLLSGRMIDQAVSITDEAGNVTPGERRLLVNGKFFEKYYKDNSLDQSFWYLTVCYGMHDDSIADALISKGASGVVGYDNSASFTYAFRTAAEIFGNSAILSADTIRRSTIEAKRIFGSADPIHRLNDNNEVYISEYTTVRYKGKATLKLIDAIEQYGMLSGTVYDAEQSSAPLVNAKIEVYQNNKRCWYYETKLQGSYSTSLPTGNYTLKISKTGYKSVEQEMEIKLGEVTSIQTDLEKESSGTISGKVCKASDRSTPITIAKIAAYQNGKLIKSTTCDSKGNYTLSVPEGSYQIKITASGYISFDNYVDVEVDQTTYLETFLLVEDSGESEGTASGQIINALTGSGLGDVTLTIRNGWNNKTVGSVIKRIKTDSNGKYSVALPLGNYTLYAEKEGYISGVVNIVVNPGITDSQNGSISPTIDGDDFRIVLTWGSSPADLDSHLNGAYSSGSRFEVFYSDKSKSEGGITICNLDVDDTDGYGPETTTLHAVSTEPYYYYVYQYSDSGSLLASEAQVKVYQGEKLLATYNVPTDQGSGRYWNVFAIINGKIVTKNTITSSEDTNYTK